MRKIITVTLVVFSVLLSYSQITADSLQVYFKLNQGKYDPSLAHNSTLMESFINDIRIALSADDLERIEVCGYASPEGPEYVNNRLSKERCEAVAEYISVNTGIDRRLIKTIPDGIAWDELRKLVAETPSVPYRKEILDILDNGHGYITGSGKKKYDIRKKRLMSLAGGAPYRWLLENIFPQLRYAVGISVIMKHETEKDLSLNLTLSELEESPIFRSTAPEIAAEVPQQTTLYLPEKLTHRKIWDPNFAIMTNLLYDGILLPNLELEWLFHPLWSLSLEGDVAWWYRRDRNQYYELAIVSTEVRRWIKPRQKWHGMYAGLFVGAGLYDLDRGRLHGYHGEGIMGGLSFGYMHPIGKYFFFDTEIGFGYLYNRYKVYEVREGHKVYIRTKQMNYFGPLKLKFSIGWRFSLFNKTKVNSTL